VSRTCERPDADAKIDLDKNLTTRDCDLGDANEHGNIPGCESPDITAKTDLDIGLKTKDCDLGDANEHKGPCERPDVDAKTDLDRNLKTINCDLGDANEHGKTPKTLSCNSANFNGTCLPRNNTKASSSGGSGAGQTCVNNCTTGTPPPVDCTKTPNDPSCTQTSTPLTTSPTTKTCPDGSVIDASANCPAQSTLPSIPPTNSNPPPSDNNTLPSGSDNGNNNPPSGGDDNGKSDNSNNNGKGDEGSSSSQSSEHSK
jgi:hypothetical protein